tara:strand:- start:280 stop:606 length:327 start_codon:yes stop_codon:yes gene_type:complete
MAQLSTKIKEYAKANGVADVNFLEDVLLQDDGSGVYIKEWNLDIAQPTDEQLTSYETAANTSESNNDVIAARQAAYGSVVEQIEYITENGLDAWQTKVAQIKADNPKE